MIKTPIVWRWRGKKYVLKGPQDFAYFSEREGYARTIWRAFGWRVLSDEHIL